MDKRNFIAGTGAAILLMVGSSRAQPIPGDQWDAPFVALTKLFKSILNATDPIADAIDKVRFRNFLNGIRSPLSQILTAKQRVKFAVNSINCSTNAAAGVSAATQDTQKLARLISDLEIVTSELETVFKPGGLKAQVRAVTAGLRNLPVRKIWVVEIDDYCRGNDAGRRSLIAKIEESIAVVTNSQAALDELIEKLG